ncbi:hypothetical protein ACFQ4C_18015 [Larkinella insperata]|uniref:Uncharacterized protein n=1 Tax=Larkinella insperata TaxID=332158 RepID=A0ABW3QFJ9_9BACT|nr:hypothetical protein [Larkinella insperata]
MNLPDLIRAWLKNPQDYVAGLQLLEATGSLSSLNLRILSRGADSFTRPRLFELLQTWLAGQVPAPAPVSAPPPASVDATGLIAPLQQQIYRLMDERTELKARLRYRMYDVEAEAEEDRRIWALRILAIIREVDELYSRIDFAQENGYLPSDKDPEETRDDRLSLMNVRTYISRYRKKLKQATSDQEKDSCMQLLQHYEAERKRLEQLI